jgi:hypothetical protein
MRQRVTRKGRPIYPHLSMKFTLHDTFNDRELSRHRSIETASRAQSKHSRAIKRTHGRNSYLPTVIMLNGQITLK